MAGQAGRRLHGWRRGSEAREGGCVCGVGRVFADCVLACGDWSDVVDRALGMWMKGKWRVRGAIGAGLLSAANLGDCCCLGVGVCVRMR